MNLMLTNWFQKRLQLKFRGPWIALLGPDGCGKSSVIKELEVLFAPPAFVGTKMIHRRPGILVPVKPGNHPPGVPIDHYSKPTHNAVRSVVKLIILGLDWFLGYWVYIVWQQIKGYLVIFDRYYLLDLWVDPLRYRYNGPSWLVRWIRKLLPKPDLVILLDAPVEVLQSRKQEVSAEESSRQRLAYLKIVQTLPNGIVVDASKPLSQVVADVKQHILDLGVVYQAGATSTISTDILRRL